ncbi:NlpC/P60 family protein [Pseudonocardia sediminis]|uniref:NlpC/P60 family protein n=1 Tax=Pseudonocardia sediminis TaxID=1397368 RepID=A0A4Q7V1C9_PSEST|nr:NlpC/P60 family protein [Pseudonocardia sediminis]
MTEPWPTGRRRRGAAGPDGAVGDTQGPAEKHPVRHATATETAGAGDATGAKNAPGTGDKPEAGGTPGTGDTPATGDTPGTGRTASVGEATRAERPAMPVRHRPRADVIRAEMALRSRGPWAAGAVVASLLVLTGVAAADAPVGAGTTGDRATGFHAAPLADLQSGPLPGSTTPSGPAPGTAIAGTGAPGASPLPDPALPVSTGAEPLTVEPAALATALPDARARTAIRVAMDQIGLPYIWGGDGPTEGDAGFDCSGLTTFAYGEAGIDLPRTAHTQFRAGPRVPAAAPLQPGDLVFYGTWAKVHHVGMYLGDGRMVNAPTFGEPVQTAYYRWNGDDYIGATRPASSPDATEPLPAVPETPDPDVPDAPPLFDAPAAPRPAAVPDPVAPQPEEPDSAAASVAGSDADIAAGKVPAPRPAAAPSARATTAPPPSSRAVTTPSAAAPRSSGPGAPTPQTAPSASAPQATPSASVATPGGTTPAGPPVAAAPKLPPTKPAQGAPPSTVLSPAVSPASPTPAVRPTSPTPVTRPQPVVPVPSTPVAPSSRPTPTTPKPTTPPRTTTPAPTRTAPTTPAPTSTTPAPPARPTPAATRSITLGGRTVALVAVPRDEAGLPARPGAWTGEDRRIVRLTDPTTVAPGSTVTLTLADGRTTRWTVRTSTVTTTAEAGETPGALVVVAPAGPGRWTVLVARPAS